MALDLIQKDQVRIPPLYRDVSECRDRFVIVSDAHDAFKEILETVCAAAIWRRKPLTRFLVWISSLSLEQLPVFHATLRPEVVCDMLTDVIVATPGGAVSFPLKTGHYIGRERGIWHGAEATHGRRHPEATA